MSKKYHSKHVADGAAVDQDVELEVETGAEVEMPIALESEPVVAASAVVVEPIEVVAEPAVSPEQENLDDESLIEELLDSQPPQAAITQQAVVDNLFQQAVGTTLTPEELQRQEIAKLAEEMNLDPDLLAKLVTQLPSVLSATPRKSRGRKAVKQLREAKPPKAVVVQAPFFAKPGFNISAVYQQQTDESGVTSILIEDDYLYYLWLNVADAQNDVRWRASGKRMLRDRGLLIADSGQTVLGSDLKTVVIIRSKTVMATSMAEYRERYKSAPVTTLTPGAAKPKAPAKTKPVVASQTANAAAPEQQSTVQLLRALLGKRPIAELVAVPEQQTVDVQLT